MTSPLLRLLIGNLRDAHRLGMLECGDHLVQSFGDSATVTWSPTTPQNAQFESQMAALKREFHQHFRPIQALRGRTIPFCNVMSLGAFERYWLTTLRPNRGDPMAADAKIEITRLAKIAAPANPSDITDLGGHFLRLNQWITTSGSSRTRRGVAVGIGELLDPATRPFWVGGRVNKPTTSAQFWRDRLGLIHVEAKARACSDLLVRLRFVAELADGELPRHAHLEHRKANMHMMWVFRPSVVHGGNRRFVQGVSADRAGRPARRGSTRDLSSPVYAEGERELLFMAGEIASARLVGVDLLDGFADLEPLRDNDDEFFVKAIAAELWS